MSSPVATLMAKEFLAVIQRHHKLYGVEPSDVWQAMAIITRDSERLYDDLMEKGVIIDDRH